MFFTTISLLALLGSTLASPVERATTPKVIDNCTKKGTVALTFDDGPYKYEQDVVNALDGGKGTFFYNGDNYDCIYDRADDIKALYDAGHTLGSHTWSHADLNKLSESEINEELEKIETAFVKILGVKPLYFRPPYGNLNDKAKKVLGERGYKKIFLWSDDTEDANGASSGSSKKVLDGVAKDYPNPHLVLDHSPIKTTSQKVLPHSVPKLKAAGYSLVTVGECLGTDESPYKKVGSPQKKDSSWKC
ncbi:hypothetical protein I350_06696 [Cryptococcus amylolentus CBS 6273]|uniref:NodB homology domain-containing protein n=1 Tax=Cryptococcus amylolentus CBS 6273 TaxID=1296118 RepID=A0A1E3JGQ4_9TREE|nr:hypothetical protein I350_06696 [Cryptococcus amylolentus CBS 6273]